MPSLCVLQAAIRGEQEPPRAQAHGAAADWGHHQAAAQQPSTPPRLRPARSRVRRRRGPHGGSQKTSMPVNQRCRVTELQATLAR